MSIFPEKQLFIDAPKTKTTTPETTPYGFFETPMKPFAEKPFRRIGLALGLATPKTPEEEIFEKVTRIQPMGGIRSVNQPFKTIPQAVKEGKEIGIKTFQGLKNLSTKLLEKFRGMPEKITDQEYRTVLNRATKEGIRKADLDLVESSLVRESASGVNVIRYATPKTEFTDSFRGGTWYMTPESPNYVNEFKATSAKPSNVGGNILFEKKIQIKNPLIINNAILEDGSFSVINSGYENYLPIKERNLANNLYNKMFGEKGVISQELSPKEMVWAGEDVLKEIGKRLGLSEQEAINISRSSNAYDAMMDKIISQGLKKEGYDSLILQNTDKAGKIIDEHIFNFGGKISKTSEGLIDLPKTAAKVEEKLVPLTPTLVKNPRWSYVGEDFIGEGKYGEVVYQSPIKTSAGNVHFGLDRGALPGEPGSGRGFPNYFSHIRYEDMADGKTRKILEIQSDLFQKGSFEREIPRTQAEFEAQKAKYGFSKIDELLRPKEIARSKEIEKLQPYSSNDPLAQLRTFREEVKRVAKDRKDTLLIPSGETAMKIEGLGQKETFQLVERQGRTPSIRYRTFRGQLTPENIEIGREVVRANDSLPWIITDIIGDGKFKAVPKDTLRSDVKDFWTSDKPKKILINGKNMYFDKMIVETFDISGKADTQHFVYKLNEEAIPREARRMGLEVEKVSLSPDGNKILSGRETGIIAGEISGWWQIKIPKERARLPVEAFGVGIIPSLQGREENSNINNKSTIPIFPSSELFVEK